MKSVAGDSNSLFRSLATLLYNVTCYFVFSCLIAVSETLMLR
jgi:hypothetical protein